jgi:hypothetical protein
VRMNYLSSNRRVVLNCLLCGAATLLPGLANAANSFIGGLHTIHSIASTVPKNGDVNPYGVAVSPVTRGNLIQGHVLVSNFNNQGNNQGTGTTIVQIGPGGDVSLFAEIDAKSLPGACPGGVGLTTALVVLRSGWVIVGSLPTSNGQSATAKAGCLIVLNDKGKPVETLSGDSINGPWDMTAFDAGNFAVLFVTNVLNGTVAANGATVNNGTVVRILLFSPAPDNDSDTDAPREIARSVIASGFGEKTDPAALVIGPTGVGLGFDGTLYVADTVANRIAAIPQALFRINNAGVGETVTHGGSLNGPLGLTIAPNGDILTVNSGDGKIVETTPGGMQVAIQMLDTTPAPPGMPGSGALFGLAIAPGGGVYFVDDVSNTLNLLH